MKEAALVLVKPDAMAKGLLGNVLLRFSHLDLEMIGMRLVRPTRRQVEEHYRNIRGKPFFEGTVNFLLGQFHGKGGSRIAAIAFYGRRAILKCRQLAGATNPEEAKPQTIRGAYGRISTKGIFENVIHVSSSQKDARREIQLWFSPDMIEQKIYPTKEVIVEKYKMRTWA